MWCFWSDGVHIIRNKLTPVKIFQLPPFILEHWGGEIWMLYYMFFNLVCREIFNWGECLLYIKTQSNACRQSQRHLSAQVSRLITSRQRALYESSKGSNFFFSWVSEFIKRRESKRPQKSIKAKKSCCASSNNVFKSHIFW